MLWCKSTFTSHYGDNYCRLFATQQQLFDFIDTTSKEGEHMEANAMWLPFSIEFPSEKEVAHKLATRALRTSSSLFLTTTDVGGKPLCKRSISANTIMAESDMHVAETSANNTKRSKRRRGGVLREDYTLLYGATPLSLQTRMFLAATAAGVARVVRDIEPLQQHLYEVIREGSPCHMYLDVERDKDYSAWCPIFEVPDSDEEDANNYADGTGNEDDCSGEMYECRRVREYNVALASAVWRPPRCCPWDCRLRADNSETTTVLLAELRTFLNVAYPELVKGAPTIKVDDAHNDEDAASVVSEEVFDVIVMRSAPHEHGNKKEEEKENGTKKHCEKFSQHYIIKFNELWFSSNADVGRLVKHFVDFLYERAAVHPRVHVALFFHDTPKEFTVLPLSHLSRTLPFLPLRCVIDTAVYSRNRMLRCLWSCKLHKTSVLQIEKKMGSDRITKLTDKVALFFETLVSLRVEHRREISIEAVVAANTSELISLRDSVIPSTSVSFSNDSSFATGNSAVGFLTAAEGERYRALAEYLAHEWSTVSGGAECHVGSIRRRGERFLLFHIEGSRYCGNVGREHLSNNIYITVDLHRRVWAQKCFDPDCVSYRSATQEIPEGLLPHVSHNWALETQTAALVSHATLRTLFR